MKKVAIMQPYFLPYIGYWQLINAVDTFVVYDNIEYTKKGWINRNRILEVDHDKLYSIPIKKASDFLPINKRQLAENSQVELNSVLRTIQNNYRKAPNFKIAYPIIEACFLYDNNNLFEFIFHSINTICRYLDIGTNLVVSSKIGIDHSLKSEQKVMAICRAEGANQYINPIGGLELYEKEEFRANGIDLKFLRTGEIRYKQLNNSFVPSLSIIDIMMFNSKEETKYMLANYGLE